VLFVGDDWAEDHHDVEVQDEQGRTLKRVRLPEGMAGMSRFHELVGRFVPEDSQPRRCGCWIRPEGWSG
jgi:hypothetical protein